MEPQSRRHHCIELGFLDRDCLARYAVRLVNFLSTILNFLLIRFNPQFVVPIPECSTTSQTDSRASTPITPGRRTGTGSAQVRAPSRSVSSPLAFRGFQSVSVLKLISLTGNTPKSDVTRPIMSFEEIRRKSSRPVVIFPECTTSNGRGLLRFTSLFNEKVPVTKYRVFVMNVK